MRATALLSLSLLSACVESVSAQPRPDAGGRSRAAQEARREARRNAVRITALTANADGAVFLSGLFGGSAGEALLGGGIGQPMDTRRDGGAGVGVLRAGGGFGGGGLGVRGTSPATPGAGRGYGAMTGPVSLDVRYDEVSLQGELPRPALRVELRRAELRTRACLRALGPHGAIDVPVRLIVRPPTTVDAVTVEGAAEGVTRCAREALQRMILGPVTAPVELSAWLRAAAVTP